MAICHSLQAYFIAYLAAYGQLFCDVNDENWRKKQNSGRINTKREALYQRSPQIGLGVLDVLERAWREVVKTGVDKSRGRCLFASRA